MDELLEAIIAAPDDDAPRRVYGDKLLEAGEPQGELIHLQCDLAAGGLARDEAVRRRVRARELLATHAARWTAGLAGIVEEAHFARGFVDEVRVAAAPWIARGPELFAAAPALRGVMLSGLYVRAADVGGPAAARGFLLDTFARAVASPAVQSLEGFGYVAPGYEHREYQWEMSDEAHWLGDQALGDVLAADIGHLRALSIDTLDWHGTRALAQAPLGRLQRLVVHDAKDDGAIVDALDPAVITSLGLSGTPWQLAKLVNLRELAIGDWPAGSASLPPRLVRLAARQASFHAVTVQALLERPELAGLVELTLSAFHLDGWTALEHARLPALRILRLAAKGIGADHARTLLRGPLGAQLELLEIGSATDRERAELEHEFGVVIDVRPSTTTVFWR
ncbi:MAG: TIGR02996 domain-containing protein [Proteobacteria bacterium]|nr:TIGR02996 domain-containing protein [Pseudomonadota bacterium]